MKTFDLLCSCEELDNQYVKMEATPVFVFMNNTYYISGVSMFCVSVCICKMSIKIFKSARVWIYLLGSTIDWINTHWNPSVI